MMPLNMQYHDTFRFIGEEPIDINGKNILLAREHRLCRQYHISVQAALFGTNANWRQIFMTTGATNRLESYEQR